MNGDGRVDEPLDGEDLVLLRRIAALWAEADPVPPGLVEHMIAVVEGSDLDAEFEMLSLVAEAAPAELGARGGGELSMIEFTGQGFHVMLRIADVGSAAGSAGSGAARRIDGWLAPAGAGTVELHSSDGDRDASSRPGGLPLQVADVDADGRFVLDGIPPGLVQLRFFLAGSRRHETPRFSL